MMKGGTGVPDAALILAVTLLLFRWAHHTPNGEVVRKPNRELETPLDEEAESVGQPVASPGRILGPRIGHTVYVVSDCFLELIKHFFPQRR
jgi:hypothetical protein